MVKSTLRTNRLISVSNCVNDLPSKLNRYLKYISTYAHAYIHIYLYYISTYILKLTKRNEQIEAKCVSICSRLEKKQKDVKHKLIPAICNQVPLRKLLKKLAINLLAICRSKRVT